MPPLHHSLQTSLLPVKEWRLSSPHSRALRKRLIMNLAMLTRLPLLPPRTNSGKIFHGSSDKLLLETPATSDTLPVQSLDTSTNMLRLPIDLLTQTTQNHMVSATKELMTAMIHTAMETMATDMAMPRLSTSKFRRNLEPCKMPRHSSSHRMRPELRLPELLSRKDTIKLMRTSKLPLLPSGMP